ncbi:head GIN domain-containing protein [Flaviaesturariibacter terrae]
MRFVSTVLALPIFLSSCIFMGGHRVTGNGVHSSQNRSVGSFDKVAVMGSMDVELAQGSAQGVRVETDENLQEYIETEVSGGTLHIRTREGYNLNEHAGLKVYVTAAEFRSLEVTGSGEVTSAGKLTGNGIDINITGSGNATLGLDMPQVKAGITGSGTVRLSGSTQTFDTRINGSGDVEAFGLLAENTKVDIAGSGDAQVFASKHLDIDIAGSGDVTYKGTAAVNQEVHGSGRAHQAD